MNDFQIATICAKILSSFLSPSRGEEKGKGHLSPNHKTF
jgi:hypothetical protein